MENVTVGSVVYSTAGNDKGNAFLVISAGERFAELVNAKTLKAGRPAKKNLKHLQTATSVLLKEQAELIAQGRPFAKDRLTREIKKAIQNQ